MNKFDDNAMERMMSFAPVAERLALETAAPEEATVVIGGFIDCVCKRYGVYVDSVLKALSALNYEMPRQKEEKE